MQILNSLESSFRDNDGYVFNSNGIFYRAINPSYFPHYNHLFQSGLYGELTEAGRLLAHQEPDQGSLDFPIPNGYKIILPEQLAFISYPYEWSFDMWREAAILTLKIAIRSVEKGMILKDATPFNIQFHNGRPVHIDSLSFEIYQPGKPWIAYRQFCECFLAPLLLMQYTNANLGRLFQLYPDGIPIDIAKRLLPWRAGLNLQVYLHIWLQARLSKNVLAGQHEGKPFSTQKLNTLLNGLLQLVTRAKVKADKTEWDDYYTGTILGKNYLEAKKDLFEKFTSSISFETVIDLGANDGYFSMLLKDKATLIIAADGDVNCINKLYHEIRLQKIKNIVPVVNVLNLPSPAIGWNNRERTDMTQRLKVDLVLALALIHHLVIGAQVPLALIARWLHNMAPNVILEFVPKSDEKVKQLLKGREDIFDDYNPGQFKNIIAEFFSIEAEEKIGDTDRILFLLKRR